MRGILLLASLMIATLSGAALAQQTPVDPRQAAKSLNLQQGSFALGDVAQIKIDGAMAYLSPADTIKLLTDVWGNPRRPTSSVLGALMPRDIDPLSQRSWAAIITFDPSGYVSDKDADEINYDELLKEMQEATREANAERAKGGYPPISLVGWARKPFYDKASHKLHWAKRLRFADSPEDTLNYNVRVLGRGGVLVLNFVASIDALADIERQIPQVMAAVDFKDGNRYADFNPSTDKVAEYGLAALIAGGVLKKVGFFGAIVAFAVAAKKFLIIGAVALFGGLFSWFRRKKKDGGPIER